MVAFKQRGGYLIELVVVILMVVHNSRLPGLANGEGEDQKQEL